MSSVNKSNNTIKKMLQGNDFSFNLLNSLDIGLAFFDVTGRVLFFNHTAARNMGGDPKDFIGKTMIDLFGKKHGQNYLERLKKTINNNETYEYEDLIDLPDRQTLYNSKYFPLFKNDHQIVGVQILSTDGLKSKEIIKELQNAKENAERYLDMAGSIFISLDADGNIKLINQKGLTILGYKREELIGKNWFDTCIPKKNRRGVKRVFKKIFAGKVSSVEHYENMIVTKEGDTRIIEWYNSSIEDENGVVQHLFSSGMDITEQRKHLNKISQSEKLLKTVTNNIPNSYISIINKNLTIDYIGGSEFSKSGLNPDDFIGLGLKDIFSDQAEQVKKYYLKTFKGKEQHFELFINDQYQFCKTVPLKNEHNKVDRILSVVENITERKKIEEAKNISEYRYGQLINTVNSGIAIYKVLNDGKYGSDYVIQDFNRMSLEIENLKREDVIGKTLKDIRPNIDTYGLIEIFRKVWQTGKPAFYPAKIYVDNNFSNYYENRVFRLPNKEIVAIYDDVTEQKTANLKIAESEKRFDLAMKASKDGLFDWNILTNEIYYSPAWKSMLGYEYDELPNDFSIWEKLTKKEDVESSWKMFNKCVSGEIDRFEMEFKMKHKDGYWVDILSRADIIHDENGKAIRLIGTHVDISDLLKAEQQVRESDARYRIFYNNSPIPYQSLDENATIKDVNPKWLDTLGYNSEEVIGKDFADFLHPSWTKHFDKNFSKLKVQGAVNNVHYKIRCKDGHYIDISLDGKISTNPEGQFVQTHCVFQDITETKQAEESILKLSTAVEQSPSIIVITDTEGNIEYANPKFTELTGYTVDEIIKCNTNILKSGELSSEDYNDLWETINSGKEWYGEFRNKTKNNSLYWEAASISAIFDEQGEITNFIKVAENITERKESEIKLSAALEKAKESDKLKSAFLANMSHEIRTPMNGILGFSDLLNQPDLDSEKRSDYIEIIKKSGKRMLSTINDLIDISRIEADQIKITKKQINFNQHLNHFYQFFKPDAEDKGLSLEFAPTLSDTKANFVTDEEKFDAIISNFINNAIKYTNNGHIKFGYNIKNESIEFYVEDTGIGVPKNKQEKIFERFMQADHSLSKPYEGSGLGLAISKAFAEMLNGKLGLDSIEGKGSTFYLELPMDESSDTPPKVEHDITKTPKDLNILLVEDDKTSRMFMEALLEDKCKSLKTASTGDMALKLVKSIPDIDLILMDIKLPDMTGYDVTKEIRKTNKDIMIIAQTAFAMKEDQNKTLKAGCNGYITKPIIQKDLFEMINQVMKEKHEKKK